MAEPATNVVKLEKRGTIDLRKDNRIGELLDEFEDANVVLLEAKRVRDELYQEIVRKLEGHEKAQVHGWRLGMPWRHRREYTVKETDYQVLYAKRKCPRGVTKEA